MKVNDARKRIKLAAHTTYARAGRGRRRWQQRGDGRVAHAREPRRVREPHRRARELVTFPPREKNAGRAQKVLYDPGAMVSPHDCWCGTVPQAAS